MELIAHYHSIKSAHLWLAGCSVSLFAARGLGVLAGARWPMSAPARRGSVVIDTLLTAAGVTLWLLLHLNPLRDAWLGSKLLLIVAYVVLGSFALKRAASRGGKAANFAAALACVGAVAAIAIAHDPAAPLKWITAR